MLNPNVLKSVGFKALSNFERSKKTEQYKNLVADFMPVILFI